MNLHVCEVQRDSTEALCAVECVSHAGPSRASAVHLVAFCQTLSQKRSH